jgi:hypothetical protein
VSSAIATLGPAIEPSATAPDLPPVPSASASADTTPRTTSVAVATLRKGGATSKHDAAPPTIQPPTPAASPTGKKNPLNVDIK